MKSTKHILLALALALGSAQAITVHHDTDKKFDVTIEWPSLITENWRPDVYQGFSRIGFDWQTYGPGVVVDVYANGPLLPPSFPGNVAGQFVVQFESFNGSEPLGATLGVFGMGGNADKIKVAQDLNSIRWTWHFDKLNAVPDAGSTLMLLGTALGLIGYGRSKLQ